MNKSNYAGKEELWMEHLCQNENKAEEVNEMSSKNSLKTKPSFDKLKFAGE